MSAILYHDCKPGLVHGLAAVNVYCCGRPVQGPFFLASLSRCCPATDAVLFPLLAFVLSSSWIVFFINGCPCGALALGVAYRIVACCERFVYSIGIQCCLRRPQGLLPPHGKLLLRRASG